MHALYAQMFRTFCEGLHDELPFNGKMILPFQIDNGLN